MRQSPPASLLALPLRLRQFDRRAPGLAGDRQHPLLRLQAPPHSTTQREHHMSDAHIPGYKADAGKLKPRLLVEGFPHALTAVAEVATLGADKYTEHGWKSVPHGVQRYTDAMYRHLLRAASGELRDKESGLLHHAHAAWNALAVLQLILEDTANPLRDKS